MERFKIGDEVVVRADLTSFAYGGNSKLERVKKLTGVIIEEPEEYKKLGGQYRTFLVNFNDELWLTHWTVREDELEPTFQSSFVSHLPMKSSVEDMFVEKTV